MNPDRDDSIDAIAEKLAAWDQALAAGEDPSSSGADSESDQDDVDFLKFLRDHWPEKLGRATDRIDTDDTLSPDGSGGAPAPSRTLGRFEIQSELGRGGFGVVFLAFDPKLERQVALKVPATFALEAPALRKRFQQEARAAAGLDHSHIVPVYDAGDEGPICYITSAYCPGTNLSLWLRHRRAAVSFGDCAALVEKLAGAIDHAHARGVIHRDLKPANVLLTRTDLDASAPGDSPPADSATARSLELPELVPRITDFGLARFVESPEQATRTGSMLGTPCYMAPEQARGSTHAIGPRADIYALGTILYELITGRAPFQGDTPAEVLVQVQCAEPVAPARMRPRTPRDLETICLKCLHKEPHRRYASARDLADDLRRFLDHRPIVARPVGRAAKAARWARRNPLAAALAASLVVLFAISFGTVTLLWLSADEQRRLAETHASAANTSAGEARASAHEARRQQDRARESYQLARQALSQLTSKIANDPRIQTGPLEDLRRVAVEVEALFLEQFVDLQGDDPEFNNERAWALFELGIRTAELGNRRQSMMYLEMAVQNFARLARAHPDDPRFLDGLCQSRMNLAAELMASGLLDEAENRFEANAKDLARLVELEPDRREHSVNLAGSFMNLAILNRHRLDAPPAPAGGDRDALLAVILRHHENNIHVLKELESLDPAAAGFSLGAAHANLGRELAARGADDQALQMLEIAAGYLAAVPADHEKGTIARHVLAMTHSHRASIYAHQDRRDEQSQALRDALEIGERLVADHPLVGVYIKTLGNQQSNYGVWMSRTGKFEESLEWLGKAVHTLASLLTRDPSDVEARQFLRYAHRSYAHSLVRLGRHSEAVPHWTAARELDTGRYKLWYGLQAARGLARSGAHAEALAIARQSPASPRVFPEALFESACVLAIVATQTGDDAVRTALCDEALELLRQAVDTGFTDGDRFDDAELDVLRDRPDFQTLIADRRSPRPDEARDKE